MAGNVAYITDENHEIGNETIIPDLMFDSEEDVSYYVDPGAWNQGLK